jgi:hypothetical protein
MRYKPWILIILGSVHLLEPVFKTLIYARMFEADIGAFLKGIFDSASLIEICSFFLLMPVAGIAIIAIKKWSFPVFIISEIWAVVVQVNLIREWNRPEQLLIAYIFIGVLTINMAVVSYFLIPAVRKVYLDESLHWWETKTRYIVKVPCMIEYSLNGEKHSAEGVIENIAEGGLYLYSENLPPQDVKIKIRFDLEFAEDLSFDLDGRVVHLKLNENQPGFGIQYLNLDDQQINKINKLLKSLELLGVAKAYQKESACKRFKDWIIQIFTTGKGLIPTTPTKYKIRPKSSKN